MDLSKLPRLAQDNALPAQPPSKPLDQPTPPSIQIAAVSSTGVRLAGPELWISAVVGLLLIGVSRHFPVYLFDQLTGRPFHSGIIFTSDGSEVPYPQVEGFAMLTDAAVFAFGAALLCDALLRLGCMMASGKSRKALMVLSLCLMVGATLLNAFVAAKLLGANMMPLISGLAVAFGGYIAFEQWRALRSVQ